MQFSDSLNHIHNDREFSTHDRDNDRSGDGNCAVEWRGGMTHVTSQTSMASISVGLVTTEV